MPLAPADLCIEVRWIAPMTARDAVLEDQALVVRDGRILDILPIAIARERYMAAVVLQRSSHLLIPGMINAHSDAAMLLVRGLGTPAMLNGFFKAQFAHDSTLSAIAEMLKSGITCFSDRHYFPEETALAASGQGMRAVIGMPVIEGATPWANSAAQCLTHSLNLRDKYRGHPLISTVFAPRSANALSDETFARLATLADELDAGIAMPLHQSSAEISESMDRFALKPIERMRKLGLLSPAFNAVHMVHATPADIDLAQRTGMSITLCPQGDLKCGEGLPPVAALAESGLRLGLGSAGAVSMSQDVWGEMRLVALMTHARTGNASINPWDALRIATRGGAEALGLDSEVGSLEAGKWADLCCVDLSGPGMQPLMDPLRQLVFNGGRDIVSDAWVAGRQLLSDGELTRLDWSSVAARSAAWGAFEKNGV